MALKTVHTSDLSGRYIEDEGQLGRLVVREHPNLAAGELPVELEVLPDELEKLAGEESQFVGLDYYAPGEASPARLIVRLDEFNELAHNGGMDDVLRSAIRAQQRLREAPGRRRGRPPRMERRREPRERINYASPEHAGEPHRGRTTEAEKEFVRTHLDEVNERLVAKGMRPIDPNDPRMRERYGLGEAA
jgi:hypothetical protein